jgi:hypothetical protein
MSSYYIHMDQGIMADLRNHELCSGQFSNCAPIVFYNDQSHIGGLYHLGGCKKLDEMNTNRLMAIETIVRPTVIYVLAGMDGDDPIFPARGHIEPVCALFKDLTVRRDFNGKSCFSSITVSEVQGALNIKLGFSMKNKLNKKEKILALPDEIGFIGEDNDEALSIWM